ncbi:MAG: glycosyltransferase family 2 protein [Bacilli bacterium]|nr:glycosyltransferase family 2 protein [Bacilli bacterium]
MNNLVYVYYVIFYLSLTYGLFFFVTGLWGFAKNGRKQITNHKPKTRFAILIAARNEEKVIGNLIGSLKKQNYPEDLYKIYVIANNCTDNTAKVAKKAGAELLPCEVPVKTKGDVLKHIFAKFMDKDDVDAFAIFDADNIVDPNFLKEMNNALLSGFNVAEGNRDSKNVTDNWLSGSYSLFYYMQNFFFNKARMNMGLSAAINGTGFVVKKSIIEKYGFNPLTLTEDSEFTAQCSLNGERIAYVEKAITYDEHPIRFIDSWNQRKRWSKGTLQCLKTYGGRLFANIFKNSNMTSLDMLMMFLAPIVQVVALIMVAMLAGFKYFGIELIDIFSYVFASGILFFIVTYLIGVLTNVFIFKINKQNLKEVTSSIFLFALFILTWIPINIVCMIKKDVTWKPISHDRNVDMEKLLNKNN